MHFLGESPLAHAPSPAFSEAPPGSEQDPPVPSADCTNTSANIDFTIERTLSEEAALESIADDAEYAASRRLAATLQNADIPQAELQQEEPLEETPWKHAKTRGTGPVPSVGESAFGCSLLFSRTW